MCHFDNAFKSIFSLSPVEDALNVLLVLADSLPEVSVPDLEPELGLEHLGGVVHVHVGPGHVLQRVVSDGEPLCQIQPQRLPPVSEDVECNLQQSFKFTSLMDGLLIKRNKNILFNNP